MNGIELPDGSGYMLRLVAGNRDVVISGHANIGGPHKAPHAAGPDTESIRFNVGCVVLSSRTARLASAVWGTSVRDEPGAGASHSSAALSMASQIRHIALPAAHERLERCRDRATRTAVGAPLRQGLASRRAIYFN